MMPDRMERTIWKEKNVTCRQMQKLTWEKNWPMGLVALLEPVPLIFLRLVLFWFFIQRLWKLTHFWHLLLLVYPNCWMVCLTLWQDESWIIPIIKWVRPEYGCFEWYHLLLYLFSQCIWCQWTWEKQLRQYICLLHIIWHQLSAIRWCMWLIWRLTVWSQQIRRREVWMQDCRWWEPYSYLFLVMRRLLPFYISLAGTFSILPTVIVADGSWLFWSIWLFMLLANWSWSTAPENVWRKIPG